MRMSGALHLTCLWTLLITHSRYVCGDIQFIEVQEGDSVVFPCVIERRGSSPPIGVYLKRRWLHPSEVLFMYTKSEFSVGNSRDKNRTSVSGDPSSYAVNVTISNLTPGDTDRYCCEFIVENLLSEDEHVPGKTEFFLLVGGDAAGPVDRGWVEACPGGSVVLPCFPEHGEGLAVEGVSLKRQRDGAAVEVLYHSKRHHGGGPPASSSSSSSSQHPTDRFQLSSAPGPGGITYRLTLQQLQPEDSGLYSCQLLQHSRPDSSSRLGRRATFVSVQGGRCDCSSSSSTLLYVLSSAVFLLLLLLLACVWVNLHKKRHSGGASPPPQPPIYEEMVGVKPPGRKLAPRHLEDMESEYRNCSVDKSCTENHYESPSGAL